MLGTPFLELKKISKGYGSKQTLKMITLSINKGEIFSVVGPSGSGKTTLLRIIDCLEKADTGELCVEGTNYSQLSPSTLHRKIGMVFQNPVVFNTSVFNNVAYSLKFRGYPEAETSRKVNVLLDVLQLSELKARKAVTLSGGEAQRVALARALVFDPELLLLDEPTANLDPYNVSIIEGALKKINQERGTTTILVTHNVFQAKRLAKRVALILNGDLIECSESGEFFESPKDQRTLSFIKGEMVY